MSDLTFVERRTLEREFGMESGYVLDFSNRTLAEFVQESVGRDIYEVKYLRASGSKANRLRAFWELEPNHVVGKLISDLIEYCKSMGGNVASLEPCMRIAARLLRGARVEAMEAIVPEGSGREFEILAKAVRDSIEKDEPDAGLDRLHTFVVKLVGTLAVKRGVTIDKDKPLHSVFGEYVKRLRAAGLIESEMTERILKSSIGALEAFNTVRNTRSLAHDNPVLNYEESLLIFSHVCSTVRFVRALERAQVVKTPDAAEPTPTDEIPF